MVRCGFRDNGQMGFVASRVHRLPFADCWVENNNAKGVDRGWEAGGNKLARIAPRLLPRRTLRHCLVP